MIDKLIVADVRGTHMRLTIVPVSKVPIVAMTSERHPAITGAQRAASRAAIVCLMKAERSLRSSIRATGSR